MPKPLEIKTPNESVSIKTRHKTQGKDRIFFVASGDAELPIIAVSGK